MSPWLTNYVPQPTLSHFDAGGISSAMRTGAYKNSNHCVYWRCYNVHRIHCDFTLLQKCEVLGLFPSFVMRPKFIRSSWARLQLQIGSDSNLVIFRLPRPEVRKICNTNCRSKTGLRTIVEFKYAAECDASAMELRRNQHSTPSSDININAQGRGEE